MASERKRALAALGLAGALACLAGAYVGSEFGRSALDFFMAAALADARPIKPGDCPVVLVDVSSPNPVVQAVLDRAALARVIDKLCALRVAVIGMDIDFDPSRRSDGDAALAQSIRKAGRVVLVARYEKDEREPDAAPVEVDPCCGLAEAARALSLAELKVDPRDKKLRRVQHYYADPELRTRQSFSMALAEGFIAAPLDRPTARMPALEPVSHGLLLSGPGVSMDIPVDGDGLSLIQYQGPAGTIEPVTAAQVLAMDDKATALAGKVALLGNTSSDIQDAFVPPFGGLKRISGVEIHAQDLLGHLTRSRWRDAGKLLDRLQIALAALLAGVVALALGPITSLISALLIIAGLWVGDGLAFVFDGAYIDPLGPSVAVALTVLAARALIARKFLESERQMEILLETYGQVQGPILGGALPDSPSTLDKDFASKLVEAKDKLAPPGIDMEGLLGAGGMSVVLAGTDRATGRELAFKFLSPALFGDVESRARLDREARLVARLSHPNIVAVVSSGYRMGIPYIAYERVRGTSLRALLDQSRRLAPGRAAAIVREMLLGLGAAHQEGIIHRDVKPENVLITTEGVVKVTDFGVARAEESEESFKTRTGIVVGTPSYMAPESIQGQRAGPSVDIYAAGIVLYELIVGTTPFKAENLSAILLAHVRTDPMPPSERGVKLDPALESLVMAMLEKNAARRPPSALDAAKALLPFATAVLSDEPLPEMTQIATDGGTVVTVRKLSATAEETVQVSDSERRRTLSEELAPGSESKAREGDGRNH